MEDKRLLRLVKKARRGDQEAFQRIIELKGRKILYIATNLMGNTNDGEDAAQEAVIKIARSLSKLRKPELFDSWMYRIVFTVCMDEKKVKAKDPQKLVELEVAMETVIDQDIGTQPERSLEDQATREILLTTINSLPERYRMALLLYYYEELTYSEIAEVFNVSEQNVGTLLTRARKKLREVVAQAQETSPLAEYKKPAGALSAKAITQVFVLDEQQLVSQNIMKNLMGVASSSVVLLVGKNAFIRIVKCTAVAVVLLAAIGVGFALSPSFQESLISNAQESQQPAIGVATSVPSSFETIISGAYSVSDWDQLVEEEEMAFIRFIVGSDYKYSLYTFRDTLSGIDKAIIARANSVGAIQLAYKNLGEKGSLPEGIGLINAFGDWN